MRSRAARGLGAQPRAPRASRPPRLSAERAPRTIARVSGRGARDPERLAESARARGAEARPEAEPLRRFLLARTPLEGRPELAEPDARHAARVLRMVAGDALLGLDGRGRAWRLAIDSVSKSGVELAASAELAAEDPPPGAPGAALPRIVLATAVPKAQRAEELVERLTALGIAAWQPLAWRRSPPAAREHGARRGERLERIALETLKQSGRTWLPELAPLAALVDFLDGLAEREPGSALALADPSARSGLASWVRGALAGETPAPTFVVLVGPEGGFAPEERALCLAHGAVLACLGPHVLRIEHAAEAAAAIAAHAAFEARLAGGAGRARNEPPGP